MTRKLRQQLHRHRFITSNRIPGRRATQHPLTIIRRLETRTHTPYPRYSQTFLKNPDPRKTMYLLLGIILVLLGIILLLFIVVEIVHVLDCLAHLQEMSRHTIAVNIPQRPPEYRLVLWPENKTFCIPPESTYAMRALYPHYYPSLKIPGQSEDILQAIAERANLIPTTPPQVYANGSWSLAECVGAGMLVGFACVVYSSRH